jgi:hypothetical protein
MITMPGRARYTTTAEYWDSLHFDYLIYYALPPQEHKPDFVKMFPVTGKGIDRGRYAVIRIENGSGEAKKLAGILETPFRPDAVSACVPVYRDVIIFYLESGQTVSILNICFECWKMSTGFEFENIQAYGSIVYPALAQLFGQWAAK